MTEEQSAPPVYSLKAQAGASHLLADECAACCLAPIACVLQQLQPRLLAPSDVNALSLGLQQHSTQEVAAGCSGFLLCFPFLIAFQPPCFLATTTTSGYRVRMCRTTGRSLPTCRSSGTFDSPSVRFMPLQDGMWSSPMRLGSWLTAFS